MSQEVTITEIDLKAALASSKRRDRGPLGKSKPRAAHGKTKPAARPGLTQHTPINEPAAIRQLVEQTNSAAFVVVDRDPKRLTLLKQIIGRLPALIENARKGQLEEKLAQYASLMSQLTPLESVHLDIEHDNLAFRQEFVNRWKCWDSATVHRHSGDSAKNQAQTAARWKLRKRIFAVPYGQQQLFPAFQFRDGKPLKVVGEVLHCFGEQLSPWQTAAWFVTENGWLDDEMPLKVLHTNPTGVVAAAKREVEPAVP